MPALHRAARFAAILAFALCLSHCGSSTPSSPSGPTIGSMTITGTTPAMGASAQFSAMATLSNGAVQDVTSQATWQSSNPAIATVSATGTVTGVTPGDVDIRAAYQNVSASRGISIAALPCRFSVSSISLIARSAGDSLTVMVAVTQGVNCAWTASSLSAFVTIASGAAGTGNGAVVMAVAPNTGASRTGTATVAGQTVTIVQDPGANCVTSITPTSQNFGENGPAPGTVTVTAPSNCNWTAASGASFLTISSGAAGTANGTVSYSVANNDATVGRTGTIGIGGQTLTVTQDPRPCPVTVSPTHLDVDGAGCQFVGSCAVSFPITVTMTGSCTWSSTANDAWLGTTGSIGAPTGGTGSGTLTPRIDQNNGGQARSGSLTIAGQTVTVTQTACAFSLSPSAVTVASAATSILFTATSSPQCLYNFVRDTVFLGVGFQSIGYLGTNIITVSVPENTGASPRTESLKMYGRDSTGATIPIVATAPVTQSGKL